MIRVLHVIDTGGPGGAETVFLQVATRLDPRRFVSVQIVSRDGWLAEQLRARGASPVILSADGSFNVRYLLALRRLVRDSHIDVVVTHLYGSAVYGCLAGLLTGVPVIAVLHGQVDIAARERFARLKRALVGRAASRLVFVSEELAGSLRQVLGVARHKCAVIPNGVDIAAFAPQRDRSLRATLGLADDAILVGAIGNLRPAKDYPLLLQAAALLVRRSTRFHFAISGEASGSLYERLLRLRESLGLQHYVTFLGLRSDVALVLNNLDIYALSSSSEGFSIACIEAMACGVPVVATRSGGPEGIVEHGSSGLLVPTGDAQALADGIATLAFDRGAAAAMAEAGLRRVKDSFSLQRMIEHYQGLLDATVKPNK